MKSFVYIKLLLNVVCICTIFYPFKVVGQDENLFRHTIHFGTNEHHVKVIDKQLIIGENNVPAKGDLYIKIQLAKEVFPENQNLLFLPDECIKCFTIEKEHTFNSKELEHVLKLKQVNTNGSLGYPNEIKMRYFVLSQMELSRFKTTHTLPKTNWNSFIDEIRVSDKESEIIPDEVNAYNQANTLEEYFSFIEQYSNSNKKEDIIAKLIVLAKQKWQKTNQDNDVSLLEFITAFNKAKDLNVEEITVLVKEAENKHELFDNTAKIENSKDLSFLCSFKGKELQEKAKQKYLSIAEKRWLVIEKSENADEYDKFINEFDCGLVTNNKFVEKSRLALNELKKKKKEDNEFWENIKQECNPDSFQQYLKKFPNGLWARTAKDKISKYNNAEERLWCQCQNSSGTTKIDNLHTYLKKYPKGNYASKAQNGIPLYISKAEQDPQNNLLWRVNIKNAFREEDLKKENVKIDPKDKNLVESIDIVDINLKKGEKVINIKLKPTKDNSRAVFVKVRSSKRIEGFQDIKLSLVALTAEIIETTNQLVKLKVIGGTGKYELLLFNEEGNQVFTGELKNVEGNIYTLNTDEIFKQRVELNKPGANYKIEVKDVNTPEIVVANQAFVVPGAGNKVWLYLFSLMIVALLGTYLYKHKFQLPIFKSRQNKVLTAEVKTYEKKPKININIDENLLESKEKDGGINLIENQSNTNIDLINAKPQWLLMDQLWSDSYISTVVINPAFIIELNEFINIESTHAKESNSPIREIACYILGTVTNIAGGVAITFEHIAGQTSTSNSTTHVELGEESSIDLWEKNEKYKDQKLEVIGWFHTHPGHGLFLSETDLKAFGLFTKPYQVAMVLESIAENYPFAIFTKRGDGKTINNTNPEKDCNWYYWEDIVKKYSTQLSKALLAPSSK